MKPKKELVRVVKSPEGEISLDLTAKNRDAAPMSAVRSPCLQAARKRDGWKSLFLPDSRSGVRTHGGGITGK